MYRKGCVLGWSVCDPPKNTNPFICTTFTPLNHTRTIVSITTYGKSENRGKKKEGGENLNECRRALTFIYTRLLLLLNITHTLTTTISNSTLFQFYIFILLVCDLFECAISPLPSTFSRLFIWTRQLAIHTFLKFKFRLIFAVHILCSSLCAVSPFISYFENGDNSYKPTLEIVFLVSNSTDGYQF